MRKFSTLFFMLAIATTIVGQGDSAKNIALKEVVVTGQYRPQSIKNSVYQVRIINNERIRLSGATNIHQVLVNQLGFRFSNDNTLGTTDVQLFGMKGRNVKILLDGVPMTDRGDTRESLGQVDINTIERIEIVEGPMSVSYGSDALAGVINIITKRVQGSSLSVAAKLQEETAGNEYHPFGYRGVHVQNLGISGSHKKWNYTLGGSHNELDGFGGDAYGRAKEWRPKEQWLGHAKIGYVNDAINIYYRLDGLDEEIASRGAINRDIQKAIDQFYITKRLMHQLQNQWHINSKMDISTAFSFTDYNRRTKTYQHDFVTGIDKLTTERGQQDVSKFSSIVFRNTVGYEVSSKLSLQAGLDINHEKATGARIKGEPVINDYALFMSTEIKPTGRVNIRPGLRFINNSVYDAPPIVPSINTKFVLNKQLDLRLSYAYGFRSPALRELYFNFIDANHIVIGNPNLKAEHSNSFSGSLSWAKQEEDNLKLAATISGFYNVFNNLISYANTPQIGDTVKAFNIDKFKTTGGSFEGNLRYKALSTSLGFSYVGRYNSLSAEKKYQDKNLPEFTWSPEINSNIIYAVKKIKTTVGLFYKYTGKRPGYQVGINATTGQEEIMTTMVSGFHWADFTVTKSLFSHFTLSGGVKNIFNVKDIGNTGSVSVGAHSSGGPLPMGYGRSYFLGLSFQWNKK